MPAKPKIVYGDDLGVLEENIRRAIAYRAYERFEGRGRGHGHDLEDWLDAEKDLITPANVQIIDSGSQLGVCAGVPGFRADDIQIGVAPRKVIIWGQAARPGASSQSRMQMLGEIDLPSPVDPKQSTAAVANEILNVQVSKENSTHE